MRAAEATPTRTGREPTAVCAGKKFSETTAAAESTALSGLQQGLEEPVLEVGARITVAYALRLFADDETVQTLTRIFQSPNMPARRQIKAHLEALLGVGISQLIADLSGRSGSDAPKRATATDALGLLGDNRVWLPLLAALRDPDTVVRASAAWALDRCDRTEKAGKKITEALIAALNDEAIEVRKNAAINAGYTGRQSRS